MAAVQGGHRGDAQAFGHGDDAGVDRAKAEVGVGLDQLGHARPVRIDHLDSFDLTGVKRTKEAGLGCRTQAGLDQPRRLDDDWNDDDKPFCGIRVEHLCTVAMARIIGIGRAVDHAGVHDDHPWVLSDVSGRLVREELADDLFVTFSDGFAGSRVPDADKAQPPTTGLRSRADVGADCLARQLLRSTVLPFSALDQPFGDLVGDDHA